MLGHQMPVGSKDSDYRLSTMLYIKVYIQFIARCGIRKCLYLKIETSR